MLQMLRYQLGQTMRLVICLASFVAMAMAMYIVTADVPMAQLYKLQTTWSPQEFAQIILNWRNSGILPSFEAHFTLDFIYPLFYAAALIALLSKALNVVEAPSQLNRLLLMPIAAAVADWGENICHLAFLHDAALVDTGWFYLGPVFANVKWWLINLTIVAALYLFTKRGLSSLFSRR